MTWTSFYLRSTSALLLVTTLALLAAGVTAAAQDASVLYEKPVLVVDPGMHNAIIKRADVDAEGSFAVTGADDKTVRVWSLKPLKLELTIRIPSGPGDLGKIYAVAMSPDGQTIAAGGWTGMNRQGVPHKIYLFKRTGQLLGRIDGLPEVVHHLRFSRDGRLLAAGLAGTNGIRIYDRDTDWQEVARDEDYGGGVYGITFDGNGHIATTSEDGHVRLYDQAFNLIGEPRNEFGAEPFDIEFSTDGTKLAVGFYNSSSVSLLNGHTLEALEAPDTTGIDNGSLSEVAWSQDGQTLYAGGRFDVDGSIPVVAWSDAGHGNREFLYSGNLTTIFSIEPLSDGRVLVATSDPHLGMLNPEGTPGGAVASPNFDARGQESNFAVSADGTLVDFGFEFLGKGPARFDLRALRLTTSESQDDGMTSAPRQVGLEIENWIGQFYPTLNGEHLFLKPYEVSRSLAIHPNGKKFVLGTIWHLRAYDADGVELWQSPAPSDVWAVNITGDGRLVVAAYGDGTIRWHRMDDGRELLALFPMINRTDWVAWTPEGFYHATPGAYNVLQWHLNRGWDAAPDVYPVHQFRYLRRPEVLPLVLQELGIVRALGLAELVKAKNEVKVKTGAKIAPGSTLHVLTIGVGTYGEHARHLNLDYADNDARDVASALVNTQASLYSDVQLQLLNNEDATKDQIFGALRTIRRKLEFSDGGDVAVVMFSGHGAIIDDDFYLLPHDVDARGDAMADTALPISELKRRLKSMAQKARVLVLLDACRSGAAMADGSAISIDGDVLRAALEMSNVTVLTSSSSGQNSVERDEWGNGAFTEVLLRGLGPAADVDQNGLLSVTELTGYVAEHLPKLTQNGQVPGITARFQSEILVSGK